MSKSIEFVDQNLPPGPSESAWDQAKAWIETPIEFWTRCQAEFGNTFTLQFGSLGPTVLFCDPLAIRTIFATNVDCYECSPFNQHYKVVMGSQSLLALDGAEHLEQRRMLSPSFHAKSSPGWTNIVSNVAGSFIDSLKPGDELHVRREIHKLSFKIMVRVLFGTAQADIQKLLNKIFVEDVIKDYGSWSPWARFTKWHGVLRKLFSVEIRKQREKRDLDECPELSVFDRMVRYRDENENCLPDLQIQDHIFTMLVAGVDPSALATTWALYWITSNNDVAAAVTQQVANPSENENLDSGTANILHASCLESLRMYPVVTTPTGRKLLKPVEIEDRVYEPGITLLPCTYLVHRNPKTFSNPDQFNPARFLANSFQSYEYFPFGGGPRRCIGAQMGLITMKSLIAEMFRKCEFHSKTEGRVHPIRHGTLLAPSDNFRICVDKFVA